VERDTALNPKAETAGQAMRALNNGWLADVVIVITPFPQAWQQAMALLALGGRLQLGAPLPPDTDWVEDRHTACLDQITVTSR
jgi:L-iditol 2-dehydrogenase